MIGLVVVLVVLLCGVVGMWKFGSKWFGHFQAISELAGGGSGLSEEEEALRPKNLWFEECVVLFVKHTNHLNVAEACKDYWKEKLRKDLTLTPGSYFVRKGEHSFDSADFELKDDENPTVATAGKSKKSEYGLAAARNGYVRLRGPSEWPAAQFEGLAQYLSQRFNALVVELNSSGFSEEYHFGVYEQGNRMFHARRHGEMINHDYYDIINSDGDDWAIAHGYKVGPDGFKAFRISDADKITLQLGMKMGEEKKGAEVKFLVLKE